MKKLLVLLMTVACALCLAFAFAGCTDENGESLWGGTNTQQGETGGSDNTDDSGNTGDTDSSDSGSEETGNEHVHNYGELIPEKPATCTEEGLQAHYYCEGCQTYFDGDKNETTLDELKISVDPNAHNYGELIPQVMTNCEKEGMQAYYHCEDCGKYFDDKKSEKSFNDLIIPAGHHILEENQVVCKACNEQLAESLTFELNSDNTYKLTSGTPTSGGKIMIPKIYNNLPVTSIGDRAFWGCTSLENITLPNSVTSIGGGAFQSCTSLTSITLPNSVTSIGSSAFWNCTNLKGVYITDIAAWCNIDFGDITANPLSYAHNLYLNNQLVTELTAEMLQGVTTIKIWAFEGFGGTSITIPDSVTFVGDGAFQDCTSLKSVTIGNGVTSIGNYAFEGCTSFESITVSEDNQTYSSQDGILYNKDKTELIRVPQTKTNITIPDSVTSIGEYAFRDCKSLESIKVADGNTAYSSQDGILYNKNKTEIIIVPKAIKGSVTIPNGVTSIDNYTFSGCKSLKSVIIPNSVASIGYEAFYNCTILENITLPFVGNGSDKTHLGYIFGAYYSNNNSSYVPTSLKTVIITGGNSIGEEAFSGCESLTSITIPDSVTSIGNYAFANCTSLTSITIPDSVTSIGEWAFSGCESLTRITIPDSVTSIGRYAFANCTSLTSVYITDIVAWCNIDFDGSSANPLYYANNLYIDNQLVTKLTAEMLQGVTKIKAYAFNGCTNLTSVTIGNGVTSIGSSAFSGCESLTSISIPNSVISIGSNAFYNCTVLETIEIPDSVISIGSEAFGGCTSLENITVTDGNTAYSSQDGILYNKDKTKLIKVPQTKTSITIPDSVTSIGNYAFEGCTSLASITIPDSVTSIGNYAFEGCTKLENVTIPDSVTSIGGYAFGGCTSLASITIPDSVTSIGKEAFSGCTSLTSITIPDSVTSIGSYAFGGCTSLTSITIPDSVTSIGEWAFSGCESLTRITIPDSVTSIGNYAFEGCTSLASISIPDSVTSIGYHAFEYCYNLTSVTFKNPNGWYRSSSSSATSGTDIQSEDLQKPETAATYLKDTYKYYYWKRKTT